MVPSLRSLLLSALIVSIGGFLLVPQPGSAQDIVRQMRQIHRTHTTRDGLPQSSVNALTVDVRGWVWVGTEDGPAYYNGRIWTPVRLPAGVSTAVVTWGETVVADRSGAVWVGTHGAGLYRVTPVEGLRTAGWSWDAVPSTAGRQVWAVLPQPGDSVWVGTDDGGLQLGVSGRWQTVAVPVELAGHLIWALDRSADGALWVGTDGAGLWRRDREGRWTVYRQPDGLGSDRVRAVHVAPDGAIWCGTDGGVSVRQPDGRWRTFTTADGLIDDGIGAIGETSDGTLWFGTGQGVSRLRAGRWSSLNRANGLVDPVVFAVVASTDGTLWFGTRRGVSVYREGGWSTLIGQDDRLGQFVYALHERPDGSLLFGTWGEGILGYDPTTGRWQSHRAGPGSLPGNNVQAFGERRDGSLWAGIWHEGVGVYERDRWRTIRAADGIGSDDVRAILERRDGSLWLGTWVGLAVDSGDGRWRHPAIGLLGQPIVHALMERRDGSLWVGTDRGLASLRDGRWQIHTELGSRPVQAIHEDADGILWVGTTDGLSAFDGSVWRTFTDGVGGSGPPLPNRFIHQVQSDRLGRVYALTNGGIARLTATGGGPLRRREYTVETFALADGLPSLDGNRSASLVDRRGRVWFGTVGGVVMLDPAEHSRSALVPTITLEALEVPELVDSVRADFLGRRQQLRGRTQLALRHDQNSFAVEVALMAYNAGAVTYQVQLIGYDRVPSPWTADFRKEYTNLPAGRYTFSVRGRDGLGNTSLPIQLNFAIAPAPWATWWARLGYGLLGLLAVAGLVRWRSDVVESRAMGWATLENERLSRLAAEAQARTAAAERETEAQAALVERERLTRLAAEAETAAALAVRQADEFRERVMASAANGICALDLSGRFTLVNRKMSEVSGYSADALIGRSWRELVTDEVRQELSDRFRSVFEGRVSDTHVESELIRRDGQRVSVALSLAPLLVDGELVGYVGAIEDVTERKQAEAQLSRMAAVIEQSGESVVITDPDGAMVYVNPTFERTSGYTPAEVLGRNPRMLQSGQHDRAFFAAMWATLRAGRIWRGELVNRHKAGGEYVEDTTILPIKDAAGRILNFAAVKRDITQTRLLEEQLRQSQKLEAIGQLAGGIAHDFNNILTVISGYAGLALLRTPAGSPIWGYIHEIKKEGGRAVNLTRQLLAVSRKQRIEPRPMDLALVLADLHQLLTRLIGEDIALTVVPPAHPCWIKADPSQIEQVFVNLVVNARDAIQMQQPGVIGHRERSVTIQTAAVDLDERTSGRHVGSATGPHILISVTDTGIGMSRVTMAKIFEPFFTTKPVGQGTGLGLATVYGIVKQNNGSILVNSEEGIGTTFRLYWPATPPAPSVGASNGEPLAVARPGSEISGGGETILLVEDEAAVRHFACDTLLALGYRVVEAADGVEALRRVSTAERPFDLVFSDLIMPKMGGEQLAQQLATRTGPTPRMLFASGYGDGPPDSPRADGVIYLHKPYSVEALARAVRAVLDAGGNGATTRSSGRKRWVEDEE